MVYIFLLTLGYTFTIVGLTYIIGYLNLLGIGYKRIEYVNFITSRIECMIVFLGLLILVLTIIFEKEKIK